MQKSQSPTIIPISNPQFGDSERNEMLAIIEKMANHINCLETLVQQLRDEIACLKGQQPRPKIPPSNLEGPKKRKFVVNEKNIAYTLLFLQTLHPSKSPSVSLTENKIVSALPPDLQAVAKKITRLTRRICKALKRKSKPGQPAGKKRQSKKNRLHIHEIKTIDPKELPEGAVFKGWKSYAVQELSIQPCNTLYKLARWQLPDGSYISGKIPKEITGHYGPRLRTFVLHQYHACRVPAHLIVQQLRTFGILISIGQVNNILLNGKESLAEEMEEVLPVAIMAEGQIQADDTGGRHQGKNEYTTIIGNRWFSLFHTRECKSRINFLKLLQGGKEEYLINNNAVEYLLSLNVPGYLPGYVGLSMEQKFDSQVAWESFLNGKNIVRQNEVRFVTEAALYASLIRHGIPKEMGVHSDDAGQFAVFIHSLCWIHEERHYRKLIMVDDKSRAELEQVKIDIWKLYKGLYRYKSAPCQEEKKKIDEAFDALFTRKTSSSLLNSQLAKTYAKKEELLRVLQRPETPLHNNRSETCARAAKIKLKISGGTRSMLGKDMRDLFLSAKQTCLKLNINFWEFLYDRESGAYSIPRLATIICERSLAESGDPPNSGVAPDIFKNIALQNCLAG